ncbi:hypothetical protein Sango_2882600 [Sesamum angolense]|uniref:DDE Tnp4 domain-containing protein n=1 Tax=Sesamum angolense TaxID=2727404 RepID=A0AAE1T692_9LAMI|nr:hypothetical protein Sango_2882600 [Sesamum angolense]
MTTPHQGRFFDNIRITKPCFYALVDALTSRGLLPQGQTSRVTSIEEVALFMQTVGLRRSDGWDIGTCLGPRVDQHRLAQNVLAICDFDVNFTYVYARWEGSAADAHVLDNAVSQDPNFSFPPIDEHCKYYLVDAGFANYQCFLAPYRGTRYHLPEWRGQVGMPSYLQHHQVDIVIACCTLHNFIRRFSNDGIIFNEPDENTPIDMDSFYHRGHPTNSEIEAQSTIRDSIAMQMWADNHPN